METAEPTPAAANVEIRSPPNPQQTDRVAKEGAEKRKREDDGSGVGVGDSDEGASNNHPHHPLWKTSLCSYYRSQRAGECSHGDSCRYAHGEAELRPRPDNSWDPTSQRAKKLLKPQDDPLPSPPGPEEKIIDVTTLDKCLIGLPRNWTSDRCKTFLDSQGILYKTANKKKGMTVGFVCFENAEQVKSAVKALKEHSTSEKRIKIADRICKSHEKKHTTGIIESHTGSEDPTLSASCNLIDGDVVGKETFVVEGVASKARCARDVVTPLAYMPYNDQLEHKKNSLLQTLKRLTRNARKACPDAVPLPEWIHNAREIGGLPCKLEGILESPLVDGYRNKCEFSVGHSLQGKRTVGFMIGNFREGMTAVEEPLNCPNVSIIACKYALIFQNFLQSSVFPVWNRIDNTGFWRQFTVREGRHPHQVVSENLEAWIAEVMLIIQVCSLGVDEEPMKSEFQRMAQALAQGAFACTPPLPLTVIVVQDHKGISNAAPVDCPLLPLSIPKAEGDSSSEKSLVAEARIHDYISNLRFSISPTAFFQVNTLAAERLYSLAGDWAELSPDTLLFDVCCGTGTIGLTLAHRVGMVIGIEMNDSAVSDAHRNAEINDIKNCWFVCGKAEDVIGNLLNQYLGVPQQHVSNILGSNLIENDGIAITKTSDVNKIHPDAGTLDVLECNAEKIVPYTEKSPADSSKENESSIHKSDGIERSIGFSTNCATDCGTTSLENEECRDAGQENLEDGGVSEENSESDGVNQDKFICEQNKGTNDASLHQFKDVIAIVDPPRMGLHPTVIKALRTHPRIRRLVYISCNPESLVANAIELCTPSADEPEKGKGNRGWWKMSSAGLARHRTKSMPKSEPFRPVKAMAVDLFPHTHHCEMVMLLER